MFGLQRQAFGTAALIAIASTAALFAEQRPPSRASENDVKQVIAHLEKHAELFRLSLASASDLEWLAGVQGPGDIDRFVTSFVDATRQLRQQFGRGQAVTSRVDEVLSRGASIDSFMEHHCSPNQVEQDWLTVRRDLEALALAYNVIWNRRAPYSRVDDVRLPGSLGSDVERIGAGIRVMSKKIPDGCVYAAIQRSRRPVLVVRRARQATDRGPSPRAIMKRFGDGASGTAPSLRRAR